MPTRGRPTKITDVVGTTPELDADGEPTGQQLPVTVADKIVAHLQRGAYVEQAAAAAGIAKSTIYDWLRGAAEAAGREHRGERLTSKDRRLLDFSYAVETAQAVAEQNSLDRIEALANGKDAAVALRAETWRLERRFAQRWGQRGSLDVTGIIGVMDGGELAESARDALGDVLGLMAERLAGVELVAPGAVVDEASPLLVATEERPDARVQAEPPTE